MAVISKVEYSDSASSIVNVKKKKTRKFEYVQIFRPDLTIA